MLFELHRYSNITVETWVLKAKVNPHSYKRKKKSLRCPRMPLPF